MHIPFFGQLLTVVVLLPVTGCGLFKQKGSDVAVPERLLEVGATYKVEENTPFYFEGLEDGEPDRFLAGGTTVRYVGPGLSAQSVMVRAGDGMEGFVDSKMLAEIAKEEKPQRRTAVSSAEPPLPTVDGNIAPVDDPEIPQIRIENPHRIAPRPILPRP